MRFPNAGFAGLPVGLPGGSFNASSIEERLFETSLPGLLCCFSANRSPIGSRPGTGCQELQLRYARAARGATVTESRLPIKDLLSFCRRHPILEVWVFGSVLDDWRPDRDVDLLVRFFPEQDVFLRFDLEEALEKMLGRKVDHVEADGGANPFIRKHIREHRVLIYAA